MATTKQQRKYSQDFSWEKHGSKTDKSFAPSCDVNTIIRHYENTGIDPYQSRKALERYGNAVTVSYDEAMRQVREIDSAFALLPSQERAKHANSPQQWLEYCQTLNAQPEPLQEVATPPETATTPDNSE